MAVIELKRKEQRSGNDPLSKTISDEISRPENTPAPPGSPMVYREESGLPERYTSWYVVWDKFEGIDDEERSRLILHAIEEAYGKPEALKVIIAMGITSEEARNLGISQPS